VVTCKPRDLHASIKWAAVTSRGLRGVEATEPILKRRPLSVVPDARRAEVNIKKFPLISHKAAVNRTHALKVLAA